MRTSILSVAVCGILLTTTVRSEDKPAEKEAVVKELDAKGVKPNERGTVAKPTVIASAEDLAKTIKEEEVAARLKKDVDFTKSQLLLFSWGGSGQDKLAFAVKEKKVIFTYTAGLTRDLRFHTHLYAIPKDYTFEVAGVRPGR
jgi:hypothetical protein